MMYDALYFIVFVWFVLSCLISNPRFLYLGETFSPLQLVGPIVTVLAIYIVNCRNCNEWCISERVGYIRCRQTGNKTNFDHQVGSWFCGLYPSIQSYSKHVSGSSIIKFIGKSWSWDVCCGFTSFSWNAGIVGSSLNSRG
jgi:hypothetical protein